MPNDDAKAAKSLIGKLRPQLKQTKAQLKELSGLNDDRLKLAGKLQAAAKAAKPPPAKGATMADLQKGAGKLQELSRLNQAADRYNKACLGVNAALSGKGQQRAMLNNLIKMAESSVEQHTGSKGGDSGRRNSREVFLALRALREGDKKLDAAEDAAKKLNRQPVQLSDKTPVSDLDGMVKLIKSEQKQISDLQTAFDQGSDVVDEQAGTLADALSAAEA